MKRILLLLTIATFSQAKACETFNKTLLHKTDQTGLNFFLNSRLESVRDNFFQKTVDTLVKRDFFLSEQSGISDIALIMMCKDEEDIIFENLSWHYAIGFRKFVILNNNSTDQTRTRLQEFREQTDAIVYIIDDPIVEHIQSRKTTGISNFAINVWPDLKWVFPVDADEFICVTRSLREILSEIPKDADSVYLPKSRYHPSDIVNGHNFFEMSHYREEFTPHIYDTKIFLRSDPDLIITLGNHSVCQTIADKTLLYTSHPDIFMVEFRDRSVYYLRNKTCNMANGYEALMKLMNQTGITEAIASPSFNIPRHAQNKLNQYQEYLKHGDVSLKQRFLVNHGIGDKAKKKHLIDDPFPIQKAMSLVFHKLKDSSDSNIQKEILGSSSLDFKTTNIFNLFPSDYGIYEPSEIHNYLKSTAEHGIDGVEYGLFCNSDYSKDHLSLIKKEEFINCEVGCFNYAYVEIKTNVKSHKKVRFETYHSETANNLDEKNKDCLKINNLLKQDDTALEGYGQDGNKNALETQLIHFDVFHKVKYFDTFDISTTNLLSNQFFDFFLHQNHVTVRNDLLKKIDPKAKREFFFTEKQGINDIALIMMCKDEEDIIFENLTWHYALGFRKFIVFNNNSKDKTRERLEDFREKTKQDSVVYIIDDPIIDYIQSEKTTAAFKFALQLWSDLKWIFPVDADEFICTTRSLREILSAIPKEADSVVLPKSRYHSQSLVYDNFFESAQYRDELNQGIWDIKVFLRNNPKLIINQGNHSVKSNSLMPLYTSHPDIFMIEFHDRSIPYLKNKIINMGQAFEEKSKTNDFHAKWRLKSYQSYLERGDLYLKEFFNNSHNLHSKFLIHDPFPIQEAIDFAFYKTHNKV